MQVVGGLTLHFADQLIPMANSVEMISIESVNSESVELDRKRTESVRSEFRSVQILKT